MTHHANLIIFKDHLKHPLPKFFDTAEKQAVFESMILLQSKSIFNPPL